MTTDIDFVSGLTLAKSKGVFILTINQLSTSASTSEVTTNKIATTAVAFSSMPSRVFALFLPKKVSAPPPIEPESPADLPD